MSDASSVPTNPIRRRLLRWAALPVAASGSSLATWPATLPMWLALGTAHAAPAPMAVLRLNHGLVLSVPRDWQAFSGGQRMTLYSDPHTTFDDVGMRTFENDDSFVANHYVDGDQFDAHLEVHYLTDSPYSQHQSVQARTTELRALDQMLHRAMLAATRDTSMKVVQWRGTVKRNVSGLTMFVSDFVRGPLPEGGNVVVRYVRVFKLDRSFTVEISYRDDVEAQMWAVSERIIGSIRSRDD